MTHEIIQATLVINGESVALSFPAHHTLLEVLRERIGLTGTKHGCELGECGACTVLLEGEPVLSCLLLAIDAEGKTVDTVEGMQEANQLHPLQTAFADLGAAQCGYCTPGILVTAKALLEAQPAPSRAQIEEALSGNLCRCTGYHKIVQAVEWAARVMQGDTSPPPLEVFFGAEILPVGDRSRNPVGGHSNDG